MYGGGQQALIVGQKLPLGDLLAPPHRGCRGCADVLLQGDMQQRKQGQVRNQRRGGEQLAVLRMHAAADLE